VPRTVRFWNLIAGRKFGKSKVAGYWLTKQAEKPYSNNWFFAPLLKQAKEIIWDFLLQITPRAAISHIDRANAILTYTNKARILLKGVDDPDAVRGPGCDAFVLDECRKIPGWFWPEVLRPELLATHGNGMFASSARGRNWQWKLQQDNATNPEWRNAIRTSFDNPTIDHEALRREIADTPKAIADQEYLSKILDHFGLVYPDFDPRVHIVQPFIIPGYWPRFEGMDWGISAPTVFLFCAIKPETGDVFFYDEHYQAGWDPRKHSITVKAKRKGIDPRLTISDPSVFNPESRGDRFGSIASDFSNYGIHLSPGQAKPKSRAWGIVGSYIRGPTPKMYVFSNNVHQIREFGMYEKDENRNEDENPREKAKKKHDHAMNAMEYVLTYINDAYRNKLFPLSGALQSEGISPELRRKIDAQYDATQRLSLKPKSSTLNFDPYTGYTS